MREVLVYVEGPSDKLGLEKLFDGIIQQAANKGNKLVFIPMHGKKPLLNKCPLKAINILRNKRHCRVFLLPDLYPPNVPFSHTTFHDLKHEVERRFTGELQRRKLDKRLKDRFYVHCFKYDFEVLVLASEPPLIKRLETETFSRQWIKPVENQNHRQCPKRIVEQLFRDSGKKYKDTIDAPWILERSDYNQLAETYNQNFKPFLNDLLTALQLQLT